MGSWPARALGLIMVCLALPETVAGENTQPEDALSRLRAAAEAAETRAEKALDQAEAVQDKAAALRERLRAATAAARQAEADALRAERRLNAIEADIAQAAAAAAASKERAERARAALALAGLMVRETRWAGLSDARHVIDGARQHFLLGLQVETLREQVAEHEANLETLESLKDQQKQQLDILRRAARNADERRTRVRELLSERRKQAKTWRETAEAERARAREFAAQAESLDDLLRRLTEPRGEVEEPLRPKLRKLALLERKLRDFTPRLAPGRGTVTPDGLKRGEDLQPPVAAILEKGFGSAEAGGLTATGMTLTARGDADVVAPDDSIVLWAGPFQNYGSVVILDAGAEYHVVLAGLADVYTQRGRGLRAGEPVGRLRGSRSGSGSARLYLEVRRGGRPIDPDPWFGVFYAPARS